MKRKASSSVPFVGPRMKAEQLQHSGTLLSDVSTRILGAEGYCTERRGKYQDCPACLETDKANDERRRAAGLRVSPRCEKYHSGCVCEVCMKRWKAKRPLDRAPRCLMCPRLIKRDMGDGLCSLECKDALIEIQKYPFPGRGPNGEPAFKKSYYAERRKDPL